MIQKLIDIALARLRDELATLISQPDDHIVLGPVAVPKNKDLPVIVLAPGVVRAVGVPRRLLQRAARGRGVLFAG